MKKIYLLGLTISFVVLSFVSNLFAQDYTQWRLPEGATARFGKGWINDIEFSPLKDQVSVATTIGVWVYDVHSGREVNLFTGDMGGANAIAYTSDGSILAAAHWDRKVRLWDVNTELPTTSRFTFPEEPGPIYAVAVSPNNRMVANGGADKSRRGETETRGLIRMWDLQTKEPLPILRYDAPVSTIAFSSNSRWLAGGSGDGTIRVWDAGTGELIHEFNEYTDPVWKVEFSPDSKWLLSVSLDGTGLLRNLRLPDAQPFTFRQHGTSIYAANFSPDDSNDGYTFVTGGSNKSIQLWNTNISNSNELAPDNLILEGHDDSVWILAFSKDGQNLASGSLDGTVKLWDMDLLRERLKLTGHTGGIKALTYTEDNRILACGMGLDSTLRLWDAGTSGQLSVLPGPAGLNKVVTFSSDGRTLATGGTGDTRDGGTILLSDVIKILTLDTNSLLKSLIGNKHGITALALSSSGPNTFSTSIPKTLASGGTDARIHLLNVANSSELKTLTGATSTVTALVFDPTSTNLYSGEENGTVRRWNSLSGIETFAFRSSFNAITALAFSPRSRFLAIGDESGKIRLFDFAEERERTIFTQHTREITALVFAADGNTLVSGSEDGTILMWDPNAASSNNRTSNTKTQQPSRKLKTTAKGDIQKALDATVSLVTQDHNGKELDRGSGFFVRPGYIATNYHVIEGTAPTHFKLVGKETAYWVDRVAATDPPHDLALLKVSDVNVSALSLGNSDKVQIGEEIYAVGNPRGWEGTVSDGIVSGIRGEGNNKWIQITAPISPGNSGGPVLNSKGEVIGIVSRGYQGDYAQNLNFAVPSNYLKALLSEVR